MSADLAAFPDRETVADKLAAPVDVAALGKSHPQAKALFDAIEDYVQRAVKPLVERIKELETKQQATNESVQHQLDRHRQQLGAHETKLQKR